MSLAVAPQRPWYAVWSPGTVVLVLLCPPFLLVLLLARGMPGRAMLWAPVVTAGLGCWVPPLWAGRRSAGGRTGAALRSGPARARLYGHAALLALAALCEGLLLAAPDPTGVLQLLGRVLAVVLVVLGAAYAGLLVPRAFPAPGAELADPGQARVARALARRAARERYRRLAAGDPAVAREVGVGRPDLPDPLDDGALLDLDALPAPALVRWAGLTADQADRVVAARERLGRLTVLEELVVCAGLPASVVERLREYAVLI